MTSPAHTIAAERRILTTSREDIERLGALLARAFDPKKMDFAEPDNYRIVLVNGSARSYKSFLIDNVAWAVFPDQATYSLSGFGNDEIHDNTRSMSGNSPLYGNRFVAVSFKEVNIGDVGFKGPPGIAFFQNVVVDERTDAELEIILRSPRPEDEDEISDALGIAELALSGKEPSSPDELKEHDKTRHIFNHVAEADLADPALREAYECALGQGAEAPRVITFRLHNPELAKNPYFQHFWAVLGEMQTNPDQGTEILIKYTDLDASDNILGPSV